MRESLVDFQLSQARHENKDMAFSSAVSCHIVEPHFRQQQQQQLRSGGLCTNVTVDLKAELNKFYPHLNMLDMKESVLNVLALYKDHSYRLMPNDIEPIKSLSLSTDGKSLFSRDLV